MAKKQLFLDFFDFLKNCLYDSNEIFYSHSTALKGLICAISSKSCDWDSSETEGKSNLTPLPHIRLWFAGLISEVLRSFDQPLNTCLKSSNVTKPIEVTLNDVQMLCKSILLTLILSST